MHKISIVFIFLLLSNCSILKNEDKNVEEKEIIETNAFKRSQQAAEKGGGIKACARQRCRRKTKRGSDLISLINSRVI